MPNNENINEEAVEEEIKQEETAEETAEEAAEETAEAPEQEEAPKAEEPEDEALSARYMRLAADFQNFKRRTEKEKSDIYQFANEKIALDIVEVMDNFDRAMSHIEDVQDKNFAEGMEKIYKQLCGLMDKHNIIEIKAEGEAFDPNFHNAVMMEDNPDFESGIVITAMQKGYTLNGKVIRPSMVKVSQ